jgi:hypothetical protein
MRTPKFMRIDEKSSVIPAKAGIISPSWPGLTRPSIFLEGLFAKRDGYAGQARV